MDPTLARTQHLSYLHTTPVLSDAQMGDLYASTIGTTVLQLKSIPTRPAEFDGAVSISTRHALKWECFGASPPSNASKLCNAELAEALSDTLEFTSSDWAAFGIEELQDNHVVESAGVYYRPAVVEEWVLREELARFGEIASVDTGTSPVIVRYLTHEAAVHATRAAAELTHIAGGIEMMYNDRSYDGRRGESGRDDDDGRGW